MQIFASIRNRPIWIVGYPHSGWRMVDETTPQARSMIFGFDITDDGAGHYLLVCSSNDGIYAADTWHESIDEALSLAQQYGLQPHEWAKAPAPKQ